MVYFQKPKDFNPQFEAVSCYLENSGKILLLKRLIHKSQGGKWGVPAGKIEKDESPRSAIIREIFEETGQRVLKQDLTKVVKAYVVEGQYKFTWYMFKASIPAQVIRINSAEHSEYIWEYPENALELNLALDEDQCIKKMFSISS